MKNTWILLLGVVLGVVAGSMVYLRLSKDENAPPPASQTFLRLGADTSISKGDIIRWEDLEEISIPADFEPLSSIAVESTPQVEAWLTSNEVRANKDMPARSFLLTESIIDLPQDRFNAGIAVDSRAITVPVSEVSSVAFFVEPGSRVDVLVTIPTYEAEEEINRTTSFGEERVVPERLIAGSLPDPTAMVTKTLLQNMRVLAVGRATSRDAYLSNASNGYGTVTLEATPEEAELVIFANSQARGGMQLVLRNPLDTEIQELEDVDWKAVSSK